MAFSRGPSIVTDGLVLALDAANHKSYPGSGNTWKDLSPNRYSATLANGAEIVIDGVSLEYAASSYDFTNDYVQVQTTELNTMTDPWTMSCWFNMKSEGYDAAQKTLALIGCSGTSSTGVGKQLGIGGGSRARMPWALIYDSTSTLRTMGKTVGYGKQLEFDTWYMMALTHDGSSAKLYVNDYLDHEISINGYSPYPSDTTEKFTIGLNRIYFHFGGYIAIANVYNKALSAQEIQQNYNATKSRFGL